MVVSISDQETTLWDQFEYAGDPEDFVWVLPVAEGEGVEIGLADQAFFGHLANSSQVTLQGPTSGGGGFGCSAGPEAPMGSPSVTVYAREVVGPYETVTIGAEDADSLTGWLTENGYAIPDALVPTITHYVDASMSFVVLRLSPDAGVAQMQPVRVTTPGTHVTFPLRMVAAGVGESVSLELFLIAEGRWEAQNFPNAEVPEDLLTYDQGTNTFNYDALAEAALASGDGRTWLTEFSGIAWEPHTSSDAREDWDVATRFLPMRPWLTRMRAELPANALSEDLILSASMLGPRYGVYYADRSTTATSPEGGGGMPGAQLLVALVAVFALWPRGKRLGKRAAHRA